MVKVSEVVGVLCKCANQLKRSAENRNLLIQTIEHCEEATAVQNVVHQHNFPN